MMASEGGGSPSMTDANNMIHITQGKFQKFIGQDTSSVREAEQRMIRKNGP